MFKKMFGKEPEKSQAPKRQSTIGIDEDETIVINLNDSSEPKKNALKPAPVVAGKVNSSENNDQNLAPPPEAVLVLPSEQDGQISVPTEAHNTPKPVAQSEIVQDDDETIVIRARDLDETSTSPLSPQSFSNNLEAEIQIDGSAWLAVTTKTQNGRIYHLSTGRNSIGRNSENQICIDIGDQNISSRNHVSIVADPKTKKFYVVPGESTNLAYLNEVPVLESCELKDKDKIQIGMTEFIFIQFYGNYVDWK